MSFDWRARLETVPHEPGVYLMRNQRGVVVYVGKAADLHARLRSYFVGGGDTRFFVASLESVLRDIETILVRSAKEALILENHLIKKHQPRFNVKLKDDKDFLQLRLDSSRDYPRLEVVRKRRRDGALYFGPYHSARAIRQTLKLVGRYFQLRTCSDTVFRTRSRPCLQYQIGRCLAPCVLEVPPVDYAARVEEVRLFLSGQGRTLARRLRKAMKAASDELDFERAARLRDQALAVERSLQEQVVDLGKAEDLDAIGLVREGAEATIQVVRIRRGLLTSSRAYHFTAQPLPSDELLSGFVGRYYEEADLPRTVALPADIADAEAHALLLTERRGAAVEVRAPQRGRLRRLVELADKNAAQSFEERKRKEDTRARVLEGLQRRLQLERLPERIECYDISQIQGAEAVGSRVVFEQGEANKAQYRHYGIREVEGQNDFAMMYEVLSRRFRPRKGEADPHPQLLVVDGGLGQLGVARAVLEDLGVFDVELASLAKSRVLDGDRSEAPERSPERVFRPGRKNPILLRSNSSELYLLQQLRDESHRFAITFHRQSRRRRNLASELDAIPGVGPARRRALLKHFGSLKRVKAASLEELQAAPGLPEPVAQAIYAAFRG